MKAERSALLSLGWAIVAVLALVAVVAPLLSPYDPRAVSGGSLEPPSGRHLLGTNAIGQDILSEIVSGTRRSLVVALAAATLTVAVGAAVGVTAGLVGGLADLVVARVVDVFLALPLFPLLVLIAALASPGATTVVLVIGLLAWPEIARVLRSQTLTLRQRGFVRAAAGFGASRSQLVRRHLLPALGPLMVIHFVTVAGTAIFLDAALAFLGVGDPTAVSWGHILFSALRHPGLYFSPAWTWWVLPPSVAITVAVLGFTFLGVGLEPRLNPRARRAG